MAKSKDRLCKDVATEIRKAKAEYRKLVKSKGGWPRSKLMDAINLSRQINLLSGIYNRTCK